ncbi:MAG: hypothetical protein ACR2PI_10320 [Hyphomicrobiaceae bacterium]
MDDDGNGNKGLSKLRRQQQQGDTAEAQASSEAAPNATADQSAVTESGSASSNSATRDELEQRVLGALRQAVSDVMQDGRQQAELPSIDMNFVATPSVADQEKPRPTELNHPASDDERSVEEIIQASELKSSPSERSPTPFLLAGVGLVLIVATMFLTMPGNDLSMFTEDSNRTTDRQVALQSGQSDQVSLSDSQLQSDRSSASEPAVGAGSSDIIEQQNTITATPSSETREVTIPERPRAAQAIKKRTLRAVNEQVQSQQRETGLERADVLRAAEVRAQLEAVERELREQREAEQERAKAERVAEQKRIAAQPAAEQKAKQEAAERKQQQQEAAERLLKKQEQEAERRRVADLQATVAKARREAAKRKQQLADQAERVRVALLRETEEKARRDAALRRQKAAAAAEQERIEAARAKQKRALAEIGIRDQRQMDELMAATKKRLQSESVITDRLNAVLEEAKQARLRANRLQSGSEALPGAWAAEEKARLKLEQVLTEISQEQAVATTPRLRHGPTLVRNAVTLQLKESNLKVSGVLIAHDARKFVVQLPSKEQVTLPVEHFDCISTGCPKRPN